MNTLIAPRLEVQSNSNVFINANTIPVSLKELREKHIIPVFAKDNEKTISQFDFIATCYKALLQTTRRDIPLPQIRVSHPINERIPEARHKKPAELLDYEKTLYYERMMFAVQIPGFTTVISGELVELTFGGIKSYSQDSLSGKHTKQHFHLFLGYQVRVCSNMCISADIGVRSVEVYDTCEIENVIVELFQGFDHDRTLHYFTKLGTTFLNRSEFEQFIGTVRVNYLDPKTDTKDWLGDQQMGQVVKGYFNNPVFSSGLDGRISLWNIYNLMTEANKSSYIDRFIPRAIEIDNVLKLI